MKTYAVACGLCALAVAGLLWTERNESARGRWMTKPLASSCFIVAGIDALPLATSSGRALLAGLALSLVGDVLLIRMSSERWFMAGTAAFGLAHVAYAGAFVARGVSPFAMEGAAFLAVVMAALVLAWLLPRVPRDMRGSIIGYAVIISAMVACAVGTFAAHGGSLILAGALMFYASDLSVARDRFVKPSFVNRAWGLPLYYAAQLTLAASLGG